MNSYFGKFGIALAIVATSLCTTAMAAVTLDVDDNIKVTAINGQAYNTSPFQRIEQHYTLQPGKHVITARYDRLYDLPGDNHDYLKSGDVTVSVDLADNQTYRLSMVGQPERYEDAKAYAQKPTLAVLKGKQVLASQQTQSARGGLLGGVGSAIGGLFGGQSAVQANTQAIASIDGHGAISTSVKSDQPVVNPANASTLDKFMSLWLQASPAEREKIRQWVSDN